MEQAGSGARTPLQRTARAFESSVALISRVAIGLAAAWFAVRALVAAGPANIPRLAELGIDAPTILFTVAVVVFVAVAVGIFVRLRGRGGEPPRRGGWRELEGPEFR